MFGVEVNVIDLFLFVCIFIVSQFHFNVVKYEITILGSILPCFSLYFRM